MSERKPFQFPLRLVARFAFTTLVMLAIMFLAAGTVRWWEAWAYSIITLTVLFISRLVLIKVNPELAVERASADQREDVEPWDRILMPLTAIYLPGLSWILAGIDHRLNLPPDLPAWVQVAALLVLVSGSILGTWAMLANNFFSSQVRIQQDRGHQVINSGPYSVIRHPGYAGLVLSWIAAPFFFSSYLVLANTIVAVIATGVRTSKEDRFLQENLPGYREYTKEVRWRWIPGIW